MISRTIKEESVKRVNELLDKANDIAITCHMSPDGDAMGSSLGLCRVLQSIGKNARVITPDAPPKYLNFLPGAKDVVVFSRYESFAKNLLAKADLIFCLDYNDPKRVDLVTEPLLAATAPKILVDHHLYPADFTEVTISHPDVSSTSMLVFRLLCRLELLQKIDKQAAECIYTGMMTDTGNFSYNSNDPDLYTVIAELIRKGIDKDEIYRRVYFSNTESKMRLNAFAILKRMKVYPDNHAALITLTRHELNEFHYQRGDTESLVNQPLTMPDVKFSTFLREEDGYIKVSMRSKGDFAVNTLCEQYFNGGGHKNAAGGEFFGTMDEAVKMFDQLISKL